MFMKSPQIRQFTYRPKYYQPMDPDDDDGPRIKFKRHRKSQTGKKRSTLGLVVMVIILFFLISYWLKIDTSNNDDFKVEEIIIEEIQ